MNSRIFNSYYKKLNSEQKKAVDSVEGPVMVVAGPGTGKTQILTLRIANILKQTDTSPDNILALTFTESAAFSMRKRLVDIVGSDGYRVWINTFHGFCNEIIRRYPEEFPRVIGGKAMDDVDKILLLKEIISDTRLSFLKPHGDKFFYLNPIRQKISELKRENISPVNLQKIVNKEEKIFLNDSEIYHEKGEKKGEMKQKYATELKKIERGKELVKVFKKYEKKLKEKKLYDYEDMIIETVKALENDNKLLLQLQEEYQYILADEHQDVNNSQNKLLELLSSYHESPNIFIVGDEKQAIYRFQGASLENFLYFRERFKGTLVVNLLNNYRSNQGVLDASQSLIEKGILKDKNLRKPLVSKITNSNIKDCSIKIRTFSTPESELRFLAESVAGKIEEGVEPSEIAVLFRNNNDAKEIVRVFEEKGISFSLKSDQGILEDIDIKKLIKIFECIENFGKDAYILEVLHLDFLGLDNLDVSKIARYFEKSKIPIYEIIKSNELLKKARVRERKKIIDFYNLISSWKTKSKNRSFLEFFGGVVHSSGLVAGILKSAYSVEKFEKLNSLFETVKSLVSKNDNYTLSEFLEYLDLLEEHGVSIKQKNSTPVFGSVQLMTAHRSKGMEFEYVYITNCYDGHWGNKRKLEYFRIPIGAEIIKKEEAEDDERRLFYVAITRAKNEVNASFSAFTPEGNPRLPSQFLEEIDEDKKEEKDVSDFEKNLVGKPLFLPKKATRPKASEKNFLNGVFLEQGLSVSALNNYLECPWKYFYRSLLRVPEIPQKSMLYGTAIHNAMKDFFDKIKDKELNASGGEVGKKTLLSLFEYYMSEQPILSGDIKDSLKKGRDALSGYFDKYNKTWEKNVLNEFKISILFPIDLKEVKHLRLRGDIDKVEFLNDSGEVNLVDYKTAKPKSRNVILGKTKNSNGNFKRQLDFYRLLIEFYKKGELKMLSGEIDFVEPTESGQYKKEKFEVTDNELSELKEEVKRVSKEILDLKFWSESCDDKNCKYCKMREMIK